MYLKRCEIRNFRSISNLIIEFENNFQILVGLNESGKSNILKALSLIDSSVEPADDDVRDPGHEDTPVDEAYIRFVFGLDKKQTKKIYESIKPLFEAKKYTTPIVQIGSKNYSLSGFCDYKKEGLYKINLLSKTKSACYWGLFGSHYTISKAWKKVPDNWAHFADFKNPDFRALCIEDYPEYKDHPELEEIKPTEIDKLVGKKIVELINDNLPNCIIWKYSKSNLLPGRIDIEQFKADPNKCEPLRNIFFLSGFEKIGEAITEAQSKTNGVTNLLKRLSKSATKHLQTVWPEYKKLSITLTQNGSVIQAGIEDEFNFYSLERRSDGFKRFVTFLLMISAEARTKNLCDSLIIIDEPDVGLHPSGIQYLREELQKVAKQNYVAIATHSIFMIDKDRIDRHLIVKKEKEVTKVVSEYSCDMLDEEVIFRALGYSLFELLKKKNIIFEGWTDKHTFQCWLNSSQHKRARKNKWKDYGMLHALGAKDVQRVAAHLEDFDREYLIISDADQPSLDYKKKFRGKYKWLTYHDLGFPKKNTIEDFLKENYVVEKIQQTLDREQLGNNIDIPLEKTFNEKLQHIFNILKVSKKERDRLKKLTKISIFDNLNTKVINLDRLVSAIEKHS